MRRDTDRRRHDRWITRSSLDHRTMPIDRGRSEATVNRPIGFSDVDTSERAQELVAYLGKLAEHLAGWRLEDYSRLDVKPGAAVLDVGCGAGEVSLELARRVGPDFVVKFGADSDNDRAVVDPSAYARTNALGAQTLLEVSRRNPVSCHLHVSTI